MPTTNLPPDSLKGITVVSGLLSKHSKVLCRTCPWRTSVMPGACATRMPFSGSAAGISALETPPHRWLFPSLLGFIILRISCIPFGRAHLLLRSEYKEITFLRALLSGNLDFTWSLHCLWGQTLWTQSLLPWDSEGGFLTATTCHCHRLFVYMLCNAILVVLREDCRMLRHSLWVSSLIWIDSYRPRPFCLETCVFLFWILFLGLHFSHFCPLHSFFLKFPGIQC